MKFAQTIIGRELPRTVLRRILGQGLAIVLLALPGGVQASDYTYITTASGIEITRYTGTGGNVIIPDIIDGLPVTSIGTEAFMYSSVTSVTIGTNVTIIGTGAFAYCGLTSITIPRGVTNIGYGAFVYCSQLTEITVDAANSYYTSVNGVLFDESQVMLVEYPGNRVGNYTIPDSVTNIEGYAFAGCSGVKSITIPSGVTRIGDGAFDSCFALTSVTIPDSVVTIGTYAFNGCTSLASVRIPSGVTNIEDGTFDACYGLTNIAIPTNVTTIGTDAFIYTGLYTLVIPSSVTSIGARAFLATSLKSVTIAGSVTNIGVSAFDSCPYLTGVYFTGNAPAAGYGAFDYDDRATIYYLPGTTGWASTFAGRPTALWKPQVQTTDASFGVRMNQFGFNITWASGQVVVVEASTDLATPSWVPLQTNTLASDTFYFSDPQWTNYPSRFYRIRSP